MLSFAAFEADPEWQTAYEASRSSGALVDDVAVRFLTPTDYSPLE